MDIKTSHIVFDTTGQTDIVDITQEVQKNVSEAGFKEGNVTVFGIGSTTGITTIEYEPGLVKTDLPEFYEKIAPYGHNYEHHNMWGDDNGSSHVRATLQGCSLTVPFTDGQLLLGTWQQIIFIDFDTRPRSRKVVTQIIGK
ncbi:MAG: YjbQ family protein [Bacteroidia bacterium]|nr:YjbQ family protein [Bacteroidia bacterium]